MCSSPLSTKSKFTLGTVFRNVRSGYAFPFLALAFACLLTPPAEATVYDWTGTTSANSDWGTGSNWSPAGPPTTGANGFSINAGSSAVNPVNYNTGTTTTLGPSGSQMTLGNTATDSGYLVINSGTLAITGQTTSIGLSGTGNLTINAGGTFIKEAGQFNVGANSGAIGTVTVNAGGVFTFRNTNSNETIGGAGTGVFNLNGGTLNLNSSNTRLFNVGTGTGSGTLSMKGGTVTAAGATATQTINLGYNAGGGTGNGTLIGYGTIEMVNPTSNTGNFQVGGQVIADGTEVTMAVGNHVLSINQNSATPTTNDNTSGATHFGWYTSNKGALDLKTLSIGGSGNVFWGDDQNSTALWTPGSATTVLVNSAYSHFTTGSGTADISLLDPTRTVAVNGSTALLANGTGKAFLNIWQLDLDVANTLDIFSVRYDESFSLINAADAHGALLGFYYWDGSSGSWTDLTGSTTLDTTNFLASYSGSQTFTTGYFALAANVVPEPSVVGLLMSGLLPLLFSRSRRSS